MADIDEIEGSVTEFSRRAKKARKNMPENGIEDEPEMEITGTGKGTTLGAPS